MARTTSSKGQVSPAGGADGARVVVRTPAQLGAVVRAVRKQQGITQSEISNLSHVFIGEVERGKPTVRLDKVLQLLRELGIEVIVDVPAGVTFSLPADDERS